MYSIRMQPEMPLYRCRLCGAASYRRLTHRGPDGVMSYSGLYRCSGCSVTFADPAAWRESPAIANPTRATEEQAGARPTQPQAAVPSDAAPGASLPHVARLSTWGSMLPGLRDPTAFGNSDADYAAIKEAARRAGRSKHKGLRG